MKQIKGRVKPMCFKTFIPALTPVAGSALWGRLDVDGVTT